MILNLPFADIRPVPHYGHLDASDLYGQMTVIKEQLTLPARQSATMMLALAILRKYHWQ